MKVKLVLLIAAIASLTVVFSVIAEIVEEAWVQIYNGTGNGDDYVNAIAVDEDGSVIVTGFSSNGSNNDYVTIKYDKDGALAWSQAYNGTGNGDDEAQDIAVDSDGNVYVTGSVFRNSTDDYCTIKYDTAGNLAWIKFYNGSLNGYDIANAIAVDDSSNTYVTGYAMLDSGFSAVTIKYDTLGNVVWTEVFDELGTSLSQGKDVALDAAGNVYVSIGDYANSILVKYDLAGNALWTKTFNNPMITTRNEPVDLAVDVIGNSYVTGDFVDIFGDKFIFTIKYDPSGNLLWTALRADIFVNAIAADIAGSGYVTGRSTGSSMFDDYGTIKYNPAGTEEWIDFYDGETGSPEWYSANATDIVVDDESNALVTGIATIESGEGSFVTIKYDTAGNLIWRKDYIFEYGVFPFPVPIIALGASDSAYVSGSIGNGSNSDIATIKYISGDCVIDGVGYSDGESNPENACEICDAFLSTIEWIVLVDTCAIDSLCYADGEQNPANACQVCNIATSTIDWTLIDNGCAIDNVCYADGEKNPSNACEVCKITTSTTAWTVLDDGTFCDNEQFYEDWVEVYEGGGGPQVAFDGSENTYVTFGSYNGSDNDIVTVKYDSDGSVVSGWPQVYDGGSSEYDPQIAVDGSGNAIVTFNSDNGSNTDIVTVKYGPDGTPLWPSPPVYNGGYSDFSSHMVLDGSGNTYVTIESYNGSNFYIVTVKYGPDGTPLWPSPPVYNGGVYDRQPKIAVDGSGNAYVTFMSQKSGGFEDYDIITIKYDSSGSVVSGWPQVYDGGSKESGPQIVLDGFGNVYVTFDSYTSSNSDIVTVKYGPDGTSLWGSPVIYDGGDRDYSPRIALDSSGNLYVTFEWYFSGNYGIATVKYDSSGSVISRWPMSYDNSSYPKIAVDDFGNVYVNFLSGYSGGDQITTIKYGPNGMSLWASPPVYDRGSYEYSNNIVVDGSGTAYVTFQSWGGSDYDIVTIKYASYDDGLFCNGFDVCSGGTCSSHEDDPCNDNVNCTNDSCDEIGDTCVNQANDAYCDNGDWCDGSETCDAVADCQDGADPCDPVTQTCNEVDDICESFGPIYLTVTARLHGSWDGAAHTCESLVQIDLYDETMALVDSLFDVTLTVDGTAQVNLLPVDLAFGNYYVVLRHLNHVDLMTGELVVWDGATAIAVDFTDPANVECGTSTMYEYSDGIWTMPAGDIDPDDRVALSDFNYLRTHWTETNPACDLDCDGFCRLGDFNKLRQTWNTQGCAP